MTEGKSSSETWFYLALVGFILFLIMLIICIICCICCRDKSKKEDAEVREQQGVVVAAESDRQISGGGADAASEQDFEIPHDGLCKLCGKDRLELMNIELLCGAC